VACISRLPSSGAGDGKHARCNSQCGIRRASQGAASRATGIRRPWSQRPCSRRNPAWWIAAAQVHTPISRWISCCAPHAPSSRSSQAWQSWQATANHVRGCARNLRSLDAPRKGDVLRTGGTNTHKGAIWIIGLLVAGAARKGGVTQIVETASAIARIPDRQFPRLATHGDAVRRRFGARGARGEAEDGFPHVDEVRAAHPANGIWRRARSRPSRR
jgi:hypothetical protein